MIVMLECPSGTNDALAELTRCAAVQHPPRTPERRAAAAARAALITTRTPEAALRALRTFGDPKTQADAAELLGRLAGPQACAIGYDPGRRGYRCARCGATSQPAHPDGASP